MPDRTRVSAVFRIKRDEEEQWLAADGWLHRMVTGWALTCQIPAGSDAGGETEAPSSMTLILRDGEIRMKRSGAVSQEQEFRVGEWKRGTVGTGFGTMDAEVWTHRIEVRLQPSGGTAAWEYEWKMADSHLGRCSITLTIREELSK